MLTSREQLPDSLTNARELLDIELLEFISTLHKCNLELHFSSVNVPCGPLSLVFTDSDGELHPSRFLCGFLKVVHYFLSPVSDLPDADQQFSGGLQHARTLHRAVSRPL